LTRAKEASILMADLLARTRNNTPPPSAALSSVRRLRHRHIIDRLDYLRGLRRLSVVMTQSDLARALGLTQPSISSALKSAAKVADPPPGFSGASAYEIAERFVAGDIDREALVDQLSRWQDAPITGHGDWVAVDNGTTELADLGKALRDGLLDKAAYQQVLDRRSSLNGSNGELPTTTASGE
jgi:DNA-binding transcriptional regulator YdaS (Cro superfamily)